MALFGFQNSFDSAAGGNTSRRSARAETMPPSRSTGRGLATPEKEPSSTKGKGKYVIEETVEEEGEESVEVDSKGMSGWKGPRGDSHVEDETEDFQDSGEDDSMAPVRDQMPGVSPQLSLRRHPLE